MAINPQLQTLRQQRDGKLTATVAFPAANATVNTPGIDLGVGPYRQDDMMVELVVPALPNHTDPTKTITVALQSSPDNATWTNTDPLIQTSIAGVGTTGSAAKTVTFRLPPGTQEWVSFLITVPASDGNNTASSLVANLLF